MTFNRHISRNIAKRITENRQRASMVTAESSLIRPITTSLVSDQNAMLARDNAARGLQNYWGSLIPEGAPHITQFYEWLDRFGANLFERAIQRAGQKARQRRLASDPMTVLDVTKYCAAVARNMAETR